MDDMNLVNCDSKRILTWVQFLCVIAAAFLECLMIFIGKMNGRMLYEPFHNGLLICSLVFAGTVVVQTIKYRIRYPLKLSVAMAIWFIVIQTRQHSVGLTTHPCGMFLSSYILAFPFAMVTQDEGKQIALKTVALLYIAATLVLVLYSVLLIFDCVPSILNNRLFWNSYRLTVVHHPNITARTFMIGIALCLGFVYQSPRRWIKGGLLIAAGLMFVALSLTNSRTAILLTCLLCAGVVFFSVYRGSFRQLICGVIVGAAAALCLYLFSQALFQWNESRLNFSQTVQSASDETVSLCAVGEGQSDQGQYGIVFLSGNNRTVLSFAGQPNQVGLAYLTEHPYAADNIASQNSLRQDLPTLNGRITIWKMVLTAIKENPSILLWGCDNTAMLVEEFGASHTHNSWLEILARLGLPGFLISLLFTIQALWGGVYLLLRRNVDLWKKVIAMLVLCLLASGFLEPNLFFTDETWHYADFIFFLCLGYLILWRKQEISPAV